MPNFNAAKDPNQDLIPSRYLLDGKPLRRYDELKNRPKVLAAEGNSGIP